MKTLGRLEICPVVMCSSQFNSETKEMVLNMGAAGFIPKPYQSKVVLSLIKALLDVSPRRARPVNPPSFSAPAAGNTRWRHRLKELAPAREMLCDAWLGVKEYGTRLESLNRYFLISRFPRENQCNVLGWPR